MVHKVIGRTLHSDRIYDTKNNVMYMYEYNHTQAVEWIGKFISIFVDISIYLLRKISFHIIIEFHSNEFENNVVISNQYVPTLF